MKREENCPARLTESMLESGTAGVCLSCGAEAYGVEPDARCYKCEFCGEAEVYGAEEALLMGVPVEEEEEGE